MLEMKKSKGKAMEMNKGNYNKYKYNYLQDFNLLIAYSQRLGQTGATDVLPL